MTVTVTFTDGTQETYYAESYRSEGGELRISPAGYSGRQDLYVIPWTSIKIWRAQRR